MARIGIKKGRLMLPLAWLLVGASVVYADPTAIVSEATYTMGDGETPTFAEAMVLQKAKQTALEQAGTYVASHTIVRNLDLTSDEIETVTGGLMQVELLDKSRTVVGEGFRFWVKIRATITLDNLEALARRIKGQPLAEEYKKLREDYARLVKELEGWKKIISKTPPSPERDSALARIQERAQVFGALQREEQAFFQRVISGETLVAEADSEQTWMDRLIATLAKDGYRIDIGQTKLAPTGSDFKLVVPVTLRLNEIVLSKVSADIRKHAGKVLDKRRVSGMFLWKGAGEATTTLVRVAQDLDTAAYFQERVGQLRVVFSLERPKGSFAYCDLGPSRYGGLGADHWNKIRRIHALDLLGTVVRKDGKEDLYAEPDAIGKEFNYKSSFRYSMHDRYNERGPDGKWIKGPDGKVLNRASSIDVEEGYVALVHDEASFTLSVSIAKDEAQLLRRITAQVMNDPRDLDNPARRDCDVK